MYAESSLIGGSSEFSAPSGRFELDLHMAHPLVPNPSSLIPLSRICQGPLMHEYCILVVRLLPMYLGTLRRCGIVKRSLLHRKTVV